MNVFSSSSSTSSSSRGSGRQSPLALALSFVVALAVFFALAVATHGVVIPAVLAVALLAASTLRRPGASRTTAQPAPEVARPAAPAEPARVVTLPVGDVAPDAAPAPAVEPRPEPVAVAETQPLAAVEPAGAVPFEPQAERAAVAAVPFVKPEPVVKLAPRPVAPAEPVADEPVAAPSGDDVVLLVEDDDALRRFTARLLERAGYRVVQARTGIEALDAAPGVTVRALVTDVVMPRMSGHELAQRLQEQHPDLAVIYTSGYAEDTIARHGIERDRVAFLQKPFQSAQLVETLSRALAA